MNVIIFSHTHWDREWYRPFQSFRLRLCEVINALISEFARGETDLFYLDGQTIVLEDYLELYPENETRIRELIEAGKLFIGPFYVLPDEFLVSGESLMRNLLIGINQAKQYGCREFFGYLPDSFGHNSQMPKILSSFGLDKAVLWRGAGNRKSEFLWRSDDDSAVIATYLTEGYFQDILHAKLPPEEKIEKLKDLLDKLRERAVSNKILLPVGGDHLGAVPCLKSLINEINGELTGYRLEQGTISKYFSSFSFEEKALEEVSGELRDNTRNPILPGTISTRMYLKQLNAKATWQLARVAEPLQTFLAAEGLEKERENELDYAWKLLLKNHPHDSICGCSVDEVHEENEMRYKQLNQISSGIISRCMNTISGFVSENSLVACNLSNFNFSGVIKVKTHKPFPQALPHQVLNTETGFPEDLLLDIQRVPVCEDMTEITEHLTYVENIPPFSVKKISMGSQPPLLEVTDNKISNSILEISVNTDGTINLKDIQKEKTFKNLHIISDRADTGDTYNFAPLEGDKPLKAGLTGINVVEKGPLRGVLRLTYKLQIPEKFDYEANTRSSNTVEVIITTDIILTAGAKRVEFITEWENKCENHVMSVKFPLSQKITETVSEDTFGLITRTFGPDYRVEDHIPAEKGQELHTNTAPMQRFVFAQGLGVITEGLSEYLVNDNTLSITILRATGELSSRSLNTRNFPAGPPLPAAGAQCKGRQSVRYALCIVDEPQQLFKEADEFMGSVIAAVGQRNAAENSSFFEKFINYENKNILVYAVKASENREISGVILRLANISGEQQNIAVKSSIPFSTYCELNALEEIISENHDLKSEIIFKPHELKTLRFLC